MARLDLSDRTAEGLKPRFVKAEPSRDADVADIVRKISRRVIRKLRQREYLEAGIDTAVATGYDPLLDYEPDLARRRIAAQRLPASRSARGEEHPSAGGTGMFQERYRGCVPDELLKYRLYFLYSILPDVFPTAVCCRWDAPIMPGMPCSGPHPKGDLWRYVL